ncbi:MAG: ATP-binding protein [Actinomycetota bacterium]
MAVSSRLLPARSQGIKVVESKATEGLSLALESHGERDAHRRPYRVGIRPRIFLYVSVGLIVMFGLLIVVGLRSLDQATDLVFEARLSTAKSLALILDRDLTHVAADVQGFGAELIPATEGSELDQLVDGILHHLAASDSFAFFDSYAVQVTDSQGRMLAAAGPTVSTAAPQPESRALEGDAYLILDPAGESVGGFATVATRIDDGPEHVWVYVHLSARNSTKPFDPEDYLQTGPGQADESGSEEDATYHLEVIGPQGNVVLGIGGDEAPGAPSPHWAAILDRSPLLEPVILLHEVPSESGSENHVMGVVPLAELGFTVVLEQPIDVALALPRRLKAQLFMWSGLGFVIAMMVAWFTTRAVVRPAQELTLAAERIGRGDLDTPIQVNARDEFGVLADRFESMRRQISSAYEAVGEANRVLESRVKERTTQLGNLLRRIITAQESERKRLARELHDETAQTLGALSIALGRAADSLPADAGASHDQLTKAKEMVRLLIEDTRRIIVDQRPLILDDLGLIPALRWYSESRLNDIGIETSFEVDGQRDRLPSHIESALFRIVQEATNNIARHADAKHVHIRVTSREETVRIVVSDDGKGFDSDAAPGANDGHLGLAGMRERADLLGGEIVIRSRPGEGTVISIEIPLTGVAP